MSSSGYSSKCALFIVISSVGTLNLVMICLYSINVPWQTNIQSFITTSVVTHIFLDQPPLRCLFEGYQIFHKLNVSWFITFGSALFFHRTKDFNTNDVDTGIFYDDLLPVADQLVSTFGASGFRRLSTYGSLHDGHEWTFKCPSTNTHLDIFVFYPPLLSDPKSASFAWWSASYNGICGRKRYRKCRWQFSSFTPEQMEINNMSFLVAPQKFLVEQYGTSWTVPRAYGYHESLSFPPNLINE